MQAEIETVVRKSLSMVLADEIRPEEFDLDRDLRDAYGLTSLNKVLFLTSICDETNVALSHFTEDDLAAMRTLREVVGAVAGYAGEGEANESAGSAAAPAAVVWSETASAVLENEHVRMRPLEAGDREAIRAIAMDTDIWRYFVSLVHDEASFEAFFDATLADHAAGRRAVYVVVDKRDERVAGSMSFGNMSQPDLRLEIGWSWLGADFRGRGVNRWAKFLLLRHAFEVLGAERVEFKTDALNRQARRGLVNIGATEEGILRAFNPMPDGRRRDAVFYSVLRGEWPAVKAHLSGAPSAVGST